MKLLEEGTVRLAKWVRQVMGEGCERLVLRQRSSDYDQQVRQWTLAANTDADELAEQIEIAGQEDGTNFRGPVIYGVFAYRRNEKTMHARTFFTVEGKASFGGEVMESETPDARGITSQMMRHTEASARIAIGHTMEVIQQYKRMLEQRDKRIEELEARYFKVVDLYEKLSSMQHERDLEVLRMQQAEKRTEFLKEKLDMLAPVLVSKLLGKSGAAPVLGEELVRQFLKSLSPEQMERIVGVLAPEQAAVMSEVYLAYGEREVAREEAARANGVNGVHGAKKTNGHNGQANGH